MPTMTSEEMNHKARDAALAAVSAMSVQPTNLIQYESRGLVAIIGGEAAIQATAMMPGNLKPHLIYEGKGSVDGVPTTRMRQRGIHIDGYLGNFTITVEGVSPDAEAKLDDTESVKADLVLDLSDVPILKMPLKPPGYMSSGVTESEMQAAVDELAFMTGTFEKPKFFEYNPSICAHGRSGISACTRCIDACPAEAISSLAETIEVEPHLCQGGGACATACPSGAIRYVYPSADDTLALMRRLLRVYIEQGGEQPVVVFHATESAMPESYATNLLPVSVEELGSVGIEIWLSALAYGARSVLLFDDGNVPAPVSREIGQQLITANEILAGMGYPADTVRCVDAHSFVQAQQPMMPLITPAKYAGAGGKRQTVFLAIDALYEQAFATMDKSLPQMVTLSAGSPFGAAEIDEKTCTLCMSCVSACPGKALQSGQDVPQLRFIESNCLQCGLCSSTCPEDAISIAPRLLFDRESRNRATTLHEEEPFCCVSCGKPFATRSVISNMLAKLDGHWMFTDERSKQRLKMCDDCRVVDVIQDDDMMGKGIDRDRVTH
ncbi:MAG: 4Fe-4S binding protein [Arenicellales bacterium]|jgi:ferredoxin